MKEIKTFSIIIIIFLYSCHKQDITPPVITLIGNENINIELYNNYEELGATAIDEVDGDLTSTLQKSNNIVPDILGKYYVVYTVTDKSGNTALKYRNVNVIYTTSTDTLKNDTIAPVITLFGTNPLYINNNATFSDPGAKAMDNIYGDLTPFIIYSNNVTTGIVGNYTATYTVSDFSGNTATKIRDVQVVSDHENPVITLNGPNPLQMPKNQTYYEPGATAYDNFAGDLSSQIHITNNINTSIADTFDVRYSVSDYFGNTAVKFRKVIVFDPTNDVTPPVITLFGLNPQHTMPNGVYNDPGASAWDDIDGNRTSFIQKTDNINTAILGTYTVTYTVSDVAGNQATKNRTVIVGP